VRVRRPNRMKAFENLPISVGRGVLSDAGNRSVICPSRLTDAVFLYGRGEGGWTLLDTSDSVNSAGARTLTLTTDFALNASYPNFDLFQVDVHVLIRWSD
jgi:hypothetical protein